REPVRSAEPLDLLGEELEVGLAPELVEEEARDLRLVVVQVRDDRVRLDDAELLQDLVPMLPVDELVPAALLRPDDEVPEDPDALVQDRLPELLHPVLRDSGRVPGILV